METKSFILVVGSMKQICLNCDKTFYVSEGNYRGYPQWFRGHWDNENDRFIPDGEVPIQNKVFHARICMDEYLFKYSNYLTPIFKQLKEREGNNARTREDQTELAQATST